MKDVFRSGDSSKKFQIAEVQWYRYAPSYVSLAYHLFEGFPFIQEPSSGHLPQKFKTAEGQSHRYAPSYVSPAYHLLEGFPFIQEPPSGDLQERVLIRHHDYDQCFQSVHFFFNNTPTTEIYTLSLHDALPI